ncbi:MAG: EamA family transporter, partial [Gaiellaceae bacterium]
MTAILLACFAGLCLGALSVGTRLALRRAPSILAGSFVMNVGAFIVVALLAIATGARPADLEIDTLWPFLVIGAVVPGTTQMLYVRAVRDAGAARTQVVMATAPLVAALLAVGLLDEEWGPLLIVGTLLIVGGGMALAWDRRRPAGFRAIGITVAVVVAVVSGGRDTATRWALSETDTS